MSLPQKVEEITDVIMGNNQSLMVQAFNAQITTEDDLSVAVDIISEIKSRVKNIEKERTAIVKPINDSVSAINGKFKTITQPLIDAENALKPKILAFQKKIEEEKRRAADEEKKRREQELAAQAQQAVAQGNIEGAVRLQQQADNVVVKAEESGRGGFTGAKTVVTKRWVFEVQDIKALAAARPDLIIENAPAINSAIRDGLRDIPGLKVFQQENISVR